MNHPEGCRYLNVISPTLVKRIGSDTHQRKRMPPPVSSPLHARTVVCSPQTSFRHGAHMCTTACLHVAMGILCKRVLLAGDDDASLQKKLNHLMGLASKVHGRLEAEHATAPRMVSVHEIVNECKLDMPRLGVCMEELFVLGGSGADAVQLQVAESAHAMKYRASSCFIDAGKVPGCLLPSDTGQNSAALATSNGHTVCLAYYWDDALGKGRYALFDPYPGSVVLGLDASALLSLLQAALGMNGLLPVKRTKRDSEPYSSSRCSSADQLQQCDITLLYRVSSPLLSPKTQPATTNAVTPAK